MSRRIFIPRSGTNNYAGEAFDVPHDSVLTDESCLRDCHGPDVKFVGPWFRCPGCVSNGAPGPKLEWSQKYAPACSSSGHLWCQHCAWERRKKQAAALVLKSRRLQPARSPGLGGAQ